MRFANEVNLNPLGIDARAREKSRDSICSLTGQFQIETVWAGTAGASD